MKKLLLLFVIAFSILTLGVSKVDAACQPRSIPNDCFDPYRHACTRTSDSALFCCGQVNECNVPATPTVLTCSDGKPSGYLKCSDVLEVVVCSPLSNPQYRPYMSCATQSPCREGVGCFGGPTPVPTTPPVSTPTTGGGADPCYNPDGSLATSCFLYAVDPLNPTNSGNDGSLRDGITQMVRWIMFQTPGGIMSVLLPYLFTIAGLILFVMILWGGFEMLSGASDTKAQEAGKQRITAALIGFVLLFISFWIAQIIQYIFGVNVVG